MHGYRKLTGTMSEDRLLTMLQLSNNGNVCMCEEWLINDNVILSHIANQYEKLWHVVVRWRKYRNYTNKSITTI